MNKWITLALGCVSVMAITFALVSEGILSGGNAYIFSAGFGLLAGIVVGALV